MEKKTKIIDRLKKGDILVTNTTSAWISGPNGKDQRIGIKLFYEMINDGLIGQTMGKNFDYVLTKKGKEFKSKY